MFAVLEVLELLQEAETKLAPMKSSPDMDVRDDRNKDCTTPSMGAPSEIPHPFV
jgi:hypothetical protein